MPKGQGQKTVKSVMGKFKEGTLRSGSKSGPTVTSHKQAVAIAMKEAGLSKHKDGSYRKS